jgi:type I restriction enzyme, S subunit
MLKFLPSKWQQCSLASLGIYENGFAFNDLHWSEHGLPIVRIAQITGTQGIVDRYPKTLPDGFRLSDGDLIFSWSGTITVVRWFGGPAWLNQHLFKVVPTAGVDRSFLFHVLKASVAEMNKRTHGSTMKHIKRGELKEFLVQIPIDVCEQWKIGGILDTLDTAIHGTEAIIAKLKAVKQGLLHDLLTRGIDANGELRPPYVEAPHLYKESPLGWIPNEWVVAGVMDVSSPDRQCILTGPFGAQLGQSDFVSEGIPVLRIGNVQSGYIDWSDVQYVSQAKAENLSRFRIVPGDLLFARQGATTGRNALADERSRSALINYHIIRVSVDRDKCESNYLYALFNSERSKGQVNQEKGRGTREGINSRQIAALQFGLPSIGEQREIVERISAMNTRIGQESMVLQKMTLEKVGLMDDLLTGRIRVTSLLDPTSP